MKPLFRFPRLTTTPQTPVLALFFLATIATFTLVPPVFAGDIKPFTSDGCSAFPDGTPKQNTLWLSCCTAHDFAYWQGGTYQQRLQADIDLRQCVHATGENEIAFIMLAGVRVGGSPYFPSKFRWAYGWPYTRGYKALTSEELAIISAISAQTTEQ